MRTLVILPTYNERENIQLIIKEIFVSHPDFQIMVVDDNSPDGTQEVVKEEMKKYPNLALYGREKKEGLGRAYIDTFKKIIREDLADNIIMMDADFSHDISYLAPMTERLKKADVVVGSRYISGGGTEGWEKWRMFLSRWGNIYCRLILNMPAKDCTAGFYAMRLSALKKIDLNVLDMSGYAFQIELKYLLSKSGAKFDEHPIIFKNRRSGESKISNHIIREGILAPWKLLLRH